MKSLLLAVVVSLTALVYPTGAFGWKLGEYEKGYHNAVNAIYFEWCGHRYTYCGEGYSAYRVAECESRFDIWATNGQYLGLFQMGEYARSRYGHGGNPWIQARAAHRYYSARGWAPWSCRP